jgi:hypothetical protein
MQQLAGLHAVLLVSSVVGEEAHGGEEVRVMVRGLEQRA